jgi:hypothetical protein
MKLSEQTSNILNSTRWQLLKSDTTDAGHIIGHLKGVYGNILYKKNTTQAVFDIFNSLHNLKKNNVTMSQLCEWVENNQGYRIKNKKDYEYIVHTIAYNA